MFLYNCYKYTTNKKAPKGLSRSVITANYYDSAVWNGVAIVPVAFRQIYEKEKGGKPKPPPSS